MKYVLLTAYNVHENRTYKFMTQNFQVTAREDKDVIPNFFHMIHYYSTPVKLFHHFVVYIILSFALNRFARLSLFVYLYLHIYILALE